MILRGNKNQHLGFHALGKLLERNSEFRGKIERDNGLPLAGLIAVYAGAALGILFYAADKRFEALGIRVRHAIIGGSCIHRFYLGGQREASRERPEGFAWIPGTAELDRVTFRGPKH